MQQGEFAPQSGPAAQADWREGLLERGGVGFEKGKEGFGDSGR